MELIAYSYDLARLVFLVGAVFALAYKKLFGVTPGGIIVPGILAIILASNYIAFFASIAVAVVCYCLYHYTAGRYALEKSHTNYILITLSVLLGAVAHSALNAAGLVDFTTSVVSLICSGLIAISATKYKLSRVLRGVGTTTLLAYGVGIVAASVLPFEMLSQLTTQLAIYTELSAPSAIGWFVLSIVVSLVIYLVTGTKLGGYLLIPYIFLLSVSSPLQAALLTLAMAGNFAIVQLIQRFSFVIGLERFTYSLFGSFLFVTALDLYAATYLIPGYRPSAITTIIIVAVATNALSLAVARGRRPIRLAIPSIKRFIVIPTYIRRSKRAVVLPTAVQRGAQS
ncbi:MAG: poly-gamma-glutamate biosynthesis protein PgsC/CapC [Candidatus Saccharimonas sp.]